MVVNRFWLYNDKDIDPKTKSVYQLNMQKRVIHTVVDLLNTIFEAKFQEKKNYLYDIIGTRIMNKLSNVFNDTQLLKRIDILAMKNNKYCQSTKTSQLKYEFRHIYGKMELLPNHQIASE